MQEFNEPSIEALRLKSEQSRAALSNTVDQLGQKLSDTTEDLKARLTPAHLKREAKTYIQDKSVELVGSLEKSVRDNPLQALAIGAAIAYPLLGVAKRIPLPMMLIGAGIWMSRRGATVRPPDFESNAPAHVSKSFDADLEERQPSLAKAMKDTLAATAGRAQDSVETMGKAAVDAVSSGAKSAKDSVSTVTDDLSNRTVQVGRHSRDRFADFVEHNPLVVGGIGLAIGVFLAASLPTSKVENRVLGEGSDTLKGKARELASDAVDAAKDKTAEIAEDISEIADQNGLNKDAIGEGIDTLSDKVASVVDRGVNAALRGKAASSQVRGTNPDSYLKGDGNAGNQ
jgi:ElaB/YqjD/DUF883 family membrane-anchored ribosome-binding protein